MVAGEDELILTVSLLSGRCCTVKVSSNCYVHELRQEVLVKHGRADIVGSLLAQYPREPKAYPSEAKGRRSAEGAREELVGFTAADPCVLVKSLVSDGTVLQLGRWLFNSQTLREAHLAHGDLLHAVVAPRRQRQIRHLRAFACIRENGAAAAS
eukprot:Skav216251  [mRNA]  locus=scaffold20:163801:168036:- [translate_table: standard]